MRILMLVLANDGAPEYIELQTIWKAYTHSHSKIDCYLYKGRTGLGREAFLEGDTLLLDIEDTLETVWDKTLMAFRYFEPHLSNYDFVFRTNLSSAVDFAKYFEFCGTLPKTECCTAVIGHHDGIPFPSGAGLTLSVDLVRRLLRDTPQKLEQDDVTIGVALQTWGIDIQKANRGDYDTDRQAFRIHIPTEPVFHYRVKSDNRQLDTQVLRRLSRYLIPS